MNTAIRDALTTVAETRTPEIAVPVGLFDRARRRHRRRRLTRLICAAIVVIGAAVSVSIDAEPPPLATDERIDDMPAQLVEAPRWTAAIEHAPMRRALAAFKPNTYGTGNEDIILVGPDDQYRTFNPHRLLDRFTGVVKLSPDGRYLLTGHGDRTQLLDITSGRRRMLDAGKPLAWSPDSGQAILVHYDGPDDIGPVSGEIRIVDIPSGAIAWTIRLEPGPLPQTADAIMSHDRSMLVLQRHGDLFGYRPGGALLWHRSTNAREFLGQLAFTPDGSSFAMFDGPICFFSSATGATTKCVDYQQALGQMADKPSDYADVNIVGWQDDRPLLRFTDGVMPLAATPQWVLRAPERTGILELATDRVRWSGRQPGPPDPGPAIDRYRPVITVAAVCVPVVGFVVAIWLRRRRAKGKTATRP